MGILPLRARDRAHDGARDSVSDRVGDRPDAPGPASADRTAPVSVWLVPLDDTAAGVARSLGLLLPSGDPTTWLDLDERTRASRMHDATDRHRRLLSHVALRLLLGASLDVHPASLRFSRQDCPRCGGPHGRPTLGEGSALRFSLSRSEGHALVALRRDADVGVDLEAGPGGADGGADDSLDRWVRTEALLKATGEGLSRDPSAIGLDELSAGSWRETGTGGGAGPVVRDLVVPAPLRAAVAGPGLDRARVRVHLPATRST